MKEDFILFLSITPLDGRNYTLPKKYIMGTRGSLLALTQAGQTKKKLEELTGDHFDLKVIKTKGDANTKVPLWQLEGQNFFTKELDEALKNKEVDLVVHSHKDLGSLRPEELTLPAVTERKYAHDILLVKKETVTQWESLQFFKVGTSSPRRMTNINSFLKEFLPLKNTTFKISSEPLRGNVNTRLEKLQNGEFQGIVLALAGLERLALGDQSRPKLQELLWFCLKALFHRRPLKVLLQLNALKKGMTKTNSSTN